MKDGISESGKQFRQRLRSVAKGKMGSKDLNRDQAKESLEFLFSSEANPAQVGAFLTAMRFKGTRVDEFLGFFDAIQDYSQFIKPKVDNLLNCNGPYDGRQHYLQLSPAFAFIASAAGVPVIMHSSTELPPKKGVTTAHVLESLGIPAYLQPGEVVQQIETNGFGFLHSSRFSFGIEKLRTIRETLVYRSFLHSCEVLMNPASAVSSIIGAAHDTFLERFCEVQAKLGINHVLTIQGLDGADELPLKPVEAVEYKNGKTIKLTLSPTDFGLSEQEGIPCQPAPETASLIRKAFEGNYPDIEETLIYNGGIRIYLGKKADNIEQGIKMAKSILESGAALKKLNQLTG